MKVYVIQYMGSGGISPTAYQNYDDAASFLLSIRYEFLERYSIFANPLAPPSMSIAAIVCVAINGLMLKEE